LGMAGLRYVLWPLQGRPIDSIRVVIHLSLLTVGLIQLRDISKENSPKAEFLLLSLIWMGFLGMFGSQISFVHALQPRRFIFPFWFLITCLAALGYDSSIAAHKIQKQLAWVLCAAAIVLGWNRMITDPKTKLVSVYTEEQTKLFDYLREHRPSGRLMLEMVDPPMEADGIPFISDTIATTLKIPLSGGSNPGDFLISRFSDFTTTFWAYDTFWCGLKKDYTDADILRRYLELYNVDIMVCSSREYTEFALRFHTVLSELPPVGSFRIFKVIGPKSWLNRGKADVRFDYDQIELRSPSQGSLVLKFHWIKTLKSEPPLPLKPIYLENDPVPFIEIDNNSGADRILIFNAGLP